MAINNYAPDTYRIYKDNILTAQYGEEKGSGIKYDPLTVAGFSYASKKNSLKTHRNGYCTQRTGDIVDGILSRFIYAGKGKRTVTVSDPVSMTKLLFDHYRLSMYSFLSKIRLNGKLSQIVGIHVLNGVFTSEYVNFPEVRYWRESRDTFIADIDVELKLDTQQGRLEWKGVLVAFCTFTDKLHVTFEELTAGVYRKGYDPLNGYLVPVVKNKRIDEYAEWLWNTVFGEQTYDPRKRCAEALAERLGLNVQYYDICDSRSIKGILFFAEGELLIRPEIYKEDECGIRYRVESPTPVNIKVSAGTIVINTCSVNRDYAGFYIFHECIHNELHYLFFRLQQMGSNDPRNMKTQKIEIDDDDDEKDEMFFIENQANRGAYGLIMPYSHIKKLIDEEAARVTGFRHEGERYDKVMKNISQKICQPHFMVRIRMVQLGYIKAKGSSQTVNGEDVPPFDFDIDSWRDSRHTYVIDETTVTALCGVNKGLNRLIKKGYYVCAEGHVVRNIPRFVETRYDKHFLTDFANAHVDDCCLRFVKIYRRGNAGRTAIDHMYYDEDYLRQTAFYLSDIKNKAQLEGQELDDFDAKRLFLQEFPTNFKDAVDKLRELNDMSLDKMAELISMDRKTMTRWLEDSRKYRNEDFLTILCLIFKLPDWLSMVLFKRAHFMLDEEDKRHEAILHILRVQTEDGIEAANAYLEKNHLCPLTLEG